MSTGDRFETVPTISGIARTDSPVVIHGISEYLNMSAYYLYIHALSSSGKISFCEKCNYDLNS